MELLTLPKVPNCRKRNKQLPAKGTVSFFCLWQFPGEKWTGFPFRVTFLLEDRSNFDGRSIHCETEFLVGLDVWQSYSFCQFELHPFKCCPCLLWQCCVTVFLHWSTCLSTAKVLVYSGVGEKPTIKINQPYELTQVSNSSGEWEILYRFNLTRRWQNPLSWDMAPQKYDIALSKNTLC